MWKDGEKIWVDAELKLNRETSIINWVLVDVSDKHIQRTQNRTLLKAVNESPESIGITDSEGVIEYVNKQFCEVTGYSEEELIGNNPSALKSGIHDKEFYIIHETQMASRNLLSSSFKMHLSSVFRYLIKNKIFCLLKKVP